MVDTNNFECYVDNVNIKDIPSNTYCILWADDHNEFTLIYGQDVSGYYNLNSKEREGRSGEILLYDDKKVKQLKLPNLMSYFNYLTNNGFELISFHPAARTVFFSGTFVLLKKME